jgi:Flp pilus assembly pilin Flp
MPIKRGAGVQFSELSTHLSSGGKMKTLLMRLWKEEEGQDTVEYALLLVLISLVAIIAMSNVGVAANAVFSNAAANLAT